MDKKYVIILEADDATGGMIEKFRLEKTGQKLIDHLSAHMTFKRGFLTDGNFSEADIIGLINDFNMPIQNISFDKIEKFGDAVVLSTNDEDLKKYHKDFCNLTDSKVVTSNPEWEGDNFKPHMTLYRDSSDRSFEDDMIIKEAVFDKISLYEIDPTPNRSFAKLIFTKKLEA